MRICTGGTDVELEGKTGRLGEVMEKAHEEIDPSVCEFEPAGLHLNPDEAV